MYKVICKINSLEDNNIKILQNNKINFSKKTLTNNTLFSKDYVLDKFYKPETTNDELFNKEIKHNLDDNLYLFLYGNKDSGKIDTLLGNNSHNGILELIVKNFNYHVKIEFVEIRKNGVYDFDNNIVNVIQYDNKIKYYNLDKHLIRDERSYENFNKMLFKNLSLDKPSHKIITITYDTKKIFIVLLSHKYNITEKENINKEHIFINSSIYSFKRFFCEKYSDKIDYKIDLLISIIEPCLKNNIKSLFISHIKNGYKNQNESWNTLEFSNDLYLKNYIDEKIEKIKKEMVLDYKEIKNTKDKVDNKMGELVLKKIFVNKSSTTLIPPPLPKIPPLLPKPRQPLKLNPMSFPRIPKLPSLKKNIIVKKNPLTKKKESISPKSNKSFPQKKKPSYKDYIKKYNKNDDIIKKYSLIPFSTNSDTKVNTKMLETVNLLLYQRTIKNFTTISKINKNKYTSKYEFRELLLKTKATLEVAIKELDNILY